MKRKDLVVIAFGLCSVVTFVLCLERSSQSHYKKSKPKPLRRFKTHLHNPQGHPRWPQPTILKDFLTHPVIGARSSRQDFSSRSTTAVIKGPTYYSTVKQRVKLRPPLLNRNNNGFRQRAGGPAHVSSVGSLLGQSHKRQAAAKNNRVHFYIYPNSRDLSYREEILVGNNVSLSSYRADYHPIILIHDYLHNVSANYPEIAKDAYLKEKFPANILVADWSSLASPKFGIANNIATRYPKVSRKVGKIARQISDMLLFLSKEWVLQDPSKVHMIGFGLGAQIAGVTGNNVKRATGNLLGRITGLDPSGLQYHYTAMSEKLDKNDALFVDVYHTTTAPFGFGSSIGTVDFYPNGGGPSQPGCKSTVLDMIQDIPGMDGSCAHKRAWQYFIDSISNKKIYACRSTSFLMYRMKSFCAKPIIFGQHVSTTGSGDYFLELVHNDP